MSPRKLEQAVGGDSRRETGGHLQGHVAGEPLDAATRRTVASWRVNKWASAGCTTAESPTPRISMPGTTWPWIPGLLWGQDPRGLLGWLAPALDLRVKPFLMERALAGRGWITTVEQTHRDLRRGKPACPGTVGASPPVLRGFRVTARVRVSSWLCWDVCPVSAPHLVGLRRQRTPEEARTMGTSPGQQGRHGAVAPWICKMIPASYGFGPRSWWVLQCPRACSHHSSPGC